MSTIEIAHDLAEAAARGPGFPVVALVSSTGGQDALSTVLAGLPADLPAAVIALQHTSPRSPGLLPAILDARTDLPVRAAASGDRLTPGTVLVPPPGHHLLVTAEDTVLLVTTGHRPSPPRPSADLLLTSLAVACTTRAVAVVLTGQGEDSAAGVQAVSQLGGQVLVQDAATAVADGMPGAAAAADSPEPALPVTEIAARLRAIVAAVS